MTRLLKLAHSARFLSRAGTRRRRASSADAVVVRQEPQVDYLYSLYDALQMNASSLRQENEKRGKSEAAIAAAFCPSSFLAGAQGAGFAVLWVCICAFADVRSGNGEGFTLEWLPALPLFGRNHR